MADGTIVVFNRAYIPLFERMPNGAWKTVKGCPHYKFVREEWFYKDNHCELEKCSRSIEAMRRFGLIDPWPKESA